MGQVRLLTVETCEVVGRSQFDYVLHADGTWQPSVSINTGLILEAPVLDVVGPDKESIVLYLQELRDQFGQFDSYNVNLLYVRWQSEKHLRVAICVTPRKFKAGRRSLMDVLLAHFHEPHTHISPFEIDVMKAAVQAVEREEDEEALRMVCAAISEVKP